LAAAADVEQGVVGAGVGGGFSSGNGTGRVTVPGSSAQQEQQQGLHNVVSAGAAQGRRDVEEPLLGGGARISDST
jgi:hypothetical protein